VTARDGFRYGAADETKGGSSGRGAWCTVETSQSRVSRPERKCHGSALISSWRIIQFRFNLVIRQLRLLVKHDRNESAAYGTNHKHARPAPPNHSRSLRRDQGETYFFFPSTCLTHEILFVINFIRFARKASHIGLFQLKTGRRKMARLLNEERSIN